MISSALRRLATTALAGAILTGAALLPSGPAAAATYPTCYGKRTAVTKPYSELVYVPAVSSTGSTTCDLRMGNYNNEAVKVLQNAINKCNKPQNWAALVVDGDFGQKTKDYLLWAQDIRGTVVDGTYGPLTRDAIFWPLPSGSGCRQLA